MSKTSDRIKEIYGPDFWKEIGKKSWSNPSRSRKTGFATMDEEKHKQVSSYGGKKKKSKLEKISSS